MKGWFLLFIIYYSLLTLLGATVWQLGWISEAQLNTLMILLYFVVGPILPIIMWLLVKKVKSQRRVLHVEIVDSLLTLRPYALSPTLYLRLKNTYPDSSKMGIRSVECKFEGYPHQTLFMYLSSMSHALWPGGTDTFQGTPSWVTGQSGSSYPITVKLTFTDGSTSTIKSSVIA